MTHPSRLTRFALVLGIALAAGPGAHAQLGTENNPPPEREFTFKDPPTLRNDGLGVMAEHHRQRTAPRRVLRRRLAANRPSGT